MLLALLLATTLSWLNPNLAADTTQACGDGVTPLTTLSHVELWGTEQGAQRRLLISVPARFREGLRDTVTLNLAGRWTVEGIAVKLDGRQACPMFWYIEPPPVGVPPTNVAITKWYDIAGRHISTPTRNGIYFMRRGNEAPRKLVILK